MPGSAGQRADTAGATILVVPKGGPIPPALPRINKMKALVIGSTVCLWLIATSAGAYFYALARIGAPDGSLGYEATWRFQLVMFSIFRLPLFLVALALVLWVENRFLSGQTRR